MVDVIIIGAGAAGLMAANVLSAAGRQVMVLEGRGRIGGRIDTLHDPAWGLPIERGAEFIHGRPAETWDILRACGCGAYEIADSHHLFIRGRLREREDFFPRVEKVLGVVEKATGKDMTFAEAVRRFSRDRREDQAWAKGYVEGFDAAAAGEVSSQWLAAAQRASDKIDGDRLARIYEGYDRIITFLRTGIPQAGERICLGTVVTGIRWSTSPVEVETRLEHGPPVTFLAKRVLVTVPVGVLRLAAGERGYIAFDPALPARQQRALERLRSGAVVKVILRCREPFWEKRDPDLHFFHSPGAKREAFATWWTTLPFRTNVLTGWCGGPAAGRLSGKGAAEILAATRESLSRLLGIPRRKIQGYIAAAHVCDWQAEALSRGAYSFAAVNGAAAARQLAKPAGRRLYFAGEATHSGFTGTVAAALASGQRAARQILREL